MTELDPAPNEVDSFENGEDHLQSEEHRPQHPTSLQRLELLPCEIAEQHLKLLIVHVAFVESQSDAR